MRGASGCLSLLCDARSATRERAFSPTPTPDCDIATSSPRILNYLAELWEKSCKSGANRGGELRDFLNFSVANAGCADAHPAAGAVHQCAYRLQIEVPAPLGDVMSVTDPVAERRFPAAYIANLCH